MARKKGLREWWDEKFDALQDLGRPVKEIQPEVLYTKEGMWPVIKLVMMRYALDMYTNIMRKRAGPGAPWDSLHFIDLCAGSGLDKIQGREEDGQAVIAGTALLGPEQGDFTHYHYAEPMDGPADALEARLTSTMPPDDFTLHREEHGAAIPEIVEDIEDKWDEPHFIALIDPEGLTEVTLPDLAPLTNLGRGDFLFNFQYQGPQRAKDAAVDFFGWDEWPGDLTDEQVRTKFLEELEGLGRPMSKSYKVEAADDIRYAYDVVWCAARTTGENPWLDGFDESVRPRVEEVNGTDLEKWFFGGQQDVMDFI